ncbi:site-specific DNA-methyltransferase [Parasphingorhabdus sp.]|uniref:site-specific DNA-methyltransferase n=1 Tax=Parasphingorhabdus sp. TaxID=2709688 RepID=UPI0030029431
MKKKTKLELTWPGKEDRPKLEPRILIENPDKSTHAAARRSDADNFDNMLIKGDNLLALKALQADYAGKVKCIYVDPPYNTGSAFEHYDDGLEHSVWLSLMRDRMELLKHLLSPNGLFFVQIDDNEVAYLTVLMDEIFGRNNRLNIIAVKMSEATGVKMAHAEKRMPKQKEFVLVYKGDGSPKIRPIKIPRETWNNEYKEVLLGIEKQDLAALKDMLYAEESDSRAVDDANSLLAKVKIVSLSNFFRDNEIKTSDRDDWKWQNAWRIVQAVGAGSLKERALNARTDNEISAVLSARRKLSVFKTHFDHTSRDPRIRLLFADKYLTFNPGDFWTDIKTAGGVGEEGGVAFPKGKKPEALLQRVIETCTDPGDLVLDSFAGSGTTGAVAHKLGRRWIMVEIGDHADTHIVPRLQNVIDGSDQSGISKAVDWKGGGGFRYFTLAPSLLTQDKYGNWVITEDYNPAMLAEAMCKHMGFTYAPSAENYWQHGYSTETDFVYVTTQSLTHEACAKIAQDVGPERSLLICCKAYSAEAEAFENVTLVKIPTAILQKCEWGRDDYSLNIANLPLMENDGAPAANDLPLFGGETGDE